jgi:hypothetical protein
VNAARRHTFVDRLNDDADTKWLESRIEAFSDFSRHRFLNPQSTSKNRN